MLNRLEWDFANGANTLEKLDRILSSFRKSLINEKNDSEIQNQYEQFWLEVAEYNIYMSAILVKRQSKIYGLEDLCVKNGLFVLNNRLKIFSDEEESAVSWHLLAEIELQSKHHIIEYTRYLIGVEKLKVYLKHLQYSSDIAGSILFFLYTTCRTDIRTDVIQTLVSYKWNIEIDEADNKFLIPEIIESCILMSNITGLINLFNLCTDLRLSDYSKMTIEEWKTFLLLQYQPTAMMLFRKILKREKISPEEVLKQLFCFTSWATGKTDYIINNYLYFAYAVRTFPEKYDEYCSCFDNYDLNLPSELQIENIIEATGTVTLRWLNHLIVEKPFIELIKQNPDKIPDFIEKTEPISLYRLSRTLQYKKHQTWVENGWLNYYKNFLYDYAEKHSPEEVLNLYMKSPLKSQVDFSGVIRLLFQPEYGFVDLTKQLGNFTFCGKLKKNINEDEKTSFRVSVSNVSSSYLFPLHHSWTTLHMDELKNDFSDGDVVYFNIMSINYQGMIFAYNLSAKESVSKKEKIQKEIESIAIKNIDKIKDGTLPLQGSNCREEIRLFTLALICNGEGQILVDSGTNNEKIIEFLPYLPVSNCETTNKTLGRLLKYFISFNGTISIKPSGILHLCKNRDSRNIFVIYKVPIQDCLDIQDKLFFKKSMYWRDIATYTENANDIITRMIIDYLNSSWLEKEIEM